MRRRNFIFGGVSLVAIAAASTAGWRIYSHENFDPDWTDSWDAGSVSLIIPTANHERFRIKVVFKEALENTPNLQIGDQQTAGEQTDSLGQHFTFDAKELEADTEYQLQLFAASGQSLTGTWPLKTLPAPNAEPAKGRFLFLTCMGGADFARHPFELNPLCLHSTGRRRLLRRALSFKPDATIAIGDHVYWDTRGRSGMAMSQSPISRLTVAPFDTEQPALGGENEGRLKRIVQEQIPDVYGVALRSTPSFFVQDDHDYYENDEATEDLKTFPASPFMLEAATATQKLYYPEFVNWQGLNRLHEPDGNLSMHHGTLRFGKLVEMLIYDCRRDMDVGEQGYFMHPQVEDWIVGRTANSDANHIFNVPSTPVLWTAGKWGEWYPDVASKSADGLTITEDKYLWSAAWNKQHDRILSTISQRKSGVPLVISGDLHATGLGQITSSNDHNFAANPIISALVGTPGTGKHGWPSAFRGQGPQISKTLAAENFYEPVEENGFSIIDVTSDSVTISQFRWKPEDGAEAIDRLEPFFVRTFNTSQL